MKPVKMRHCYNCGVEIGRYADYDNLDTCGELECNREALNAASMQRQEAYEQVEADLNERDIFLDEAP